MSNYKSDQETLNGERNVLQPLPALSLTPTKALIAELQSRYPDGVVVLLLEGNDTDSYWTGSKMQAVGLCQRFAERRMWD
jgi:hypothetical protein